MQFAANAVAFRGLTSLSVGICLSLVTACGSQSNKPKNQVWDPEKNFPLGHSTGAGEYVMADPGCLNESPLTQLTSSQVFALSGGSAIQALSNLQGVTSAPTLHSHNIVGTSFGMETQVTCSADGNSASCSSDQKLTKSPTPLKICKPSLQFPRTSLESIGLTSLAYVESTYTFYDNLPLSAKHQLPAVDLQLMPKFVSSYPSSKRIKTDNLSYYSSLLKRPTIVVFPKTQLGDRLWPNVNLWESAWILAHESAHHIFAVEIHGGSSSVLANALPAKGTPIIDIDQYEHDDEDSPVAVEKLSASSDAAGRQVKFGDVISATNEAFADLFGAKVAPEANEQTNGQSGLNCFKWSRNIYSPSFADGQRKILSQEVLSQFFSTQKVEAGSDCNTPSFQDVHAIGAIIAYGLNRIFSQTSQSAPEQAALAVQWIRYMNSTVTKADASQQTLEQLIEAGVKAAARGGSVLSMQQCQVIQETFPAFAGDWLNSKYSCQ